MRTVEPPLLAGHPLPPVTRVEDVDYRYYRSEEAPTGYGSLLVELAPSSQPMALMWSTPASSTYVGDVVLAVDGDVVSRGAAGGLESGVVVSAHSAHRVTLRVTHPIPGCGSGWRSTAGRAADPPWVECPARPGRP